MHTTSKLAKKILTFYVKPQKNVNFRSLANFMQESLVRYMS